MPFDDGGISYDSIQRNHPGYALLRAENEWVRSMLSNGEERHWGELATHYLCTKTMDSRYLHAMSVAVSAARESRRLVILEVGCNLGYVGAIMRRLGHDYVGLDVQGKAIDQARAYYGPHYYCETIQSFAARTTAHFDMVCLFEVIEHVPAPREFIRACISALKVGGTLIMTTPNGDQLSETQWNSDLPPVHLSVFGRRALRVLEEDGVRVRFIDDLQPSNGDYFVRLRLRKKFQRAGRRARNSVPMNPEAPDFVYRPDAASREWRMPQGVTTTGMIVRSIVTMLGLVAGDRPVGSTIIAELDRFR